MRDRTADLLDANQALSQLSYSPVNPLIFVLIEAVEDEHINNMRFRHQR